jgi:concanavalin A-like lectin/glucanase superfamily protein
VYVDGVLRATAAHSASSKTLNFNIGARGGSFNFNSKLDDVRIYNRALSATEIQQLYTEPSS